MRKGFWGWLLLPVLGLLMGAGWMPRQTGTPDTAEVVAEGSVLIDVLANDGHLGEGLELLRVHAGRLGTTAIEDGQVRYTAGTQAGSERFGYTLRMANGRTATGVVDVAVTPQPQRLVVQGRWEYMEPWSAWEPVSVTAWLGGQAFAGEFPTPEDFIVELFVPQGAIDEVVMLEVLGEGPEGQRTRFRALVRSAGVLLEAAHPGDVLSAEDYPALRVTPFTTAVAAMLEDLNGGDWHMDEARLSALSPQVDTELMVDHAALFHGVNFGWLPMDGEGGDSYDLIASRERVQAHLAMLPGDALVDPRFHLHGFAGHFLSVWDERWDYLLVKPSAPGTVNHGRVGGLRLQANEPWDGELLDTGWTASPLVILSEVDNALDLFKADRSYESQRMYHLCEGAWVEAVRLTERVPEALRRYAITPDFEHFEYVSYHGYYYTSVDGGEVPCLADLSPGRQVWERLHGYRDGGRVSAPTPAALGRVATTLVNPAPIPGQAADEFTAGFIDFATGAVDAPGYAAQGVVDVDAAGHITLAVDALPGTPRAGRFEYRFEPVREDGHGGQEWFATSRLVDSDDDHYRTIATPLARVQPGAALDTRLLARSWTSGFNVSEQGTALPRPGPFQLHFDAGTRTGYTSSAGQPGEPFSWRVDAGVLRTRTFARDSAPGELLVECPAGAADCREVRRRVWQPVRTAVLGDGRRRVYVVEEVWAPAGTQLQRLSRRMNFYDAH